MTTATYTIISSFYSACRLEVDTPPPPPTQLILPNELDSCTPTSANALITTKTSISNAVDSLHWPDYAATPQAASVRTLAQFVNRPLISVGLFRATTHTPLKPPKPVVNEETIRGTESPAITGNATSPKYRNPDVLLTPVVLQHLLETVRSLLR